MDMRTNGMIKKFFQDESGQTTTEYILILAVVVTIIMQFKNKLLGIIRKMTDGLDSATDSAIEDMGNTD